MSSKQILQQKKYSFENENKFIEFIRQNNLISILQNKSLLQFIDSINFSSSQEILNLDCTLFKKLQKASKRLNARSQEKEVKKAIKRVILSEFVIILEDLMPKLENIRAEQLYNAQLPKLILELIIEIYQLMKSSKILNYMKIQHNFKIQYNQYYDDEDDDDDDEDDSGVNSQSQKSRKSDLNNQMQLLQYTAVLQSKFIELAGKIKFEIELKRKELMSSSDENECNLQKSTYFQSKCLLNQRDKILEKSNIQFYEQDNTRKNVEKYLQQQNIVFHNPFSNNNNRSNTKNNSLSSPLKIECDEASTSIEEDNS